MTLIKIIVLVLILACTVIAVAYNFAAIPFEEDSLANIGALLALLFFASLLLERAMDVLLTLTRAPKSEHLDVLIAEFKYVLVNKAVPPEKLEQARLELAQAQNEKREWRNGTRSISMWLGLVLGVIIAAVGIRTLGAIIDVEAIGNATQRSVFSFVDILLTGGLLAGGSDGIHKITELYRNFFESRSVQERNRTLEQKTAREGATG